MTQFPFKPLNHYQQFFQRQKVFSLLVLILLSGCSIWNAPLDPPYESSRADRLCHPFGECSEGTWGMVDGSAQNQAAEKAECKVFVDKNNKDDWWMNSVARGLAIRQCMEKKGYTLQQ